MDADAAEIIRFWFADALDSPENALRRNALWFGSSPDFDARIRERFRAPFEAARRGELESWRRTAEGALALVILLDQFSRNLFRGAAEAFASDPIAHDVAKQAIAAGRDRELALLQRVFLYLPFEHSEEMAEQNRSVELFEALEAQAPANWKPVFSGYTSYAREHRKVIARFGRFPYRNEALDRADTEDERAEKLAHRARP